MDTPPPTYPRHPVRAKFRLRPRAIIAGCAVVILILLGLVAYYSAQYYRLSHSAGLDNAAAASLVKKVGRIIQLPSDETPSIATVTDVSKLSNEPFFAHAKKDDQVLIYTKAKQAILYRPSANKIINVGPISLGTPAPDATPATGSSATP